MKIKKKYSGIIFGIMMGFCMSAFMGFVMTMINSGIDDRFFVLWLKSLGIGFFASLPLSLYLPEKLNKLVDRITQ